MRADLVLLPGDGVGPEVSAAARRVLDAVATGFGHDFSFEQHLIGGAAIDATGDPLYKIYTIDGVGTSCSGP